MLVNNGLVVYSKVMVTDDGLDFGLLADLRMLVVGVDWSSTDSTLTAD